MNIAHHRYTEQSDMVAVYHLTMQTMNHATGSEDKSYLKGRFSRLLLLSNVNPLTFEKHSLVLCLQ